MSDRSSAVEAYMNALVNSGEDAAKAAVAHLAGDVVVQTNFGRAEGIDEALALLREPRTAGILAAGPQWSEPTADGDTVTVTATLPPTAPFGGLEFVFVFSGVKIARIEQQTLPAAPLPPAELRLSAEIKDAVNGALDNQTPVLIAYRDASDEIHVSFRGTVQAYSDNQLALWARDPGGGLPRNIMARPKVTLFYHDPKTRTSYTFYGRARIVDDPASRAAIFENSHPREQQMDFRRRGVAIVVDLDKIEGRNPGGRILMRLRPAISRARRQPGRTSLSAFTLHSSRFLNVKGLWSCLSRNSSDKNISGRLSRSGSGGDCVTYRSQFMSLLSDARHAGAASVPSEEAGDAEDPARQALAVLYAEHSRRLLRLAVLLVSDIVTAETVVQDAFAAISGERRQLGDTEAAATFLLRAVVRGTRSAANRKALGGTADDSAEYGAVIDALRTLKSAQREALVLRYYASLSEEQAAAAMGVRLGELKAHVAGGMDILRVILQRQPETLARE